MEFVQFHPTTLHGTNILMTEGARGEGGYLVNGKGERFMERYAAKAMELAPRDIVARAIQTEIEEGRGVGGEHFVHLDLRHLGAERINERLPGIREISMYFAGVDPVEEPIPIQPGQHYSMGGVACDVDGRTELDGLYAAGEAACVSVHGANRLGGNSLLETIVFGKRAGEAAAAHASSVPEAPTEAMRGAIEEEVGRMGEVLSRPRGDERVYDLKGELQQVMFEHFGVFREGPAMERGLDRVRALQDRLGAASVDHRGMVFNQALLAYLELDLMLELAEVIALGALRREESRGSHSRRDFPARDDGRFLAHTLARRTSEGPALSYGPVDLGVFEVKERAY
jgi:succinate dehydrogenase / fumarate reductase flavoprotein subunit